MTRSRHPKTTTTFACSKKNPEFLFDIKTWLLHCEHLLLRARPEGLSRHAFQAPTFIGCFVVKEQGPAVLLNLYRLTSFSTPPDFDPSRFAGYLSVPRCVVSSSAEKRNYELFFEACQLGFSCRYTALVTVARIKPPSGPTDSPCQVAPASFAQMMRPQPDKSKKCSLPHRLELPFWV